MFSVSDTSYDSRSSRLRLFPLCDSRGYVSGVLRGDADYADTDCHPESVFLAWLLDLPTGVDPAQAAVALLLTSGCFSGPPASSNPITHRLYKLVLGVCTAEPQLLRTRPDGSFSSISLVTYE